MSPFHPIGASLEVQNIASFKCPVLDSPPWSPTTPLFGPPFLMKDISEHITQNSYWHSLGYPKPLLNLCYRSQVLFN